MVADVDKQLQMCPQLFMTVVVVALDCGILDCGVHPHGPAIGPVEPDDLFLEEDRIGEPGEMVHLGQAMLDGVLIAPQSKMYRTHQTSCLLGVN